MTAEQPVPYWSCPQCQTSAYVYLTAGGRHHCTRCGYAWVVPVRPQDGEQANPT